MMNWDSTLRLRPSEILYSQDSIGNFFRTGCPHWCNQIGDTLDDLCEGRCTIRDIPTISVVNHNGEWVTSDNRRLWVFKKFERLGRCTTIPVYETYHINPDKLTRTGSGTTARVRGDGPGGHWYRRQFESGLYDNSFSSSTAQRNANTRDSTTAWPSGILFLIGVAVVVFIVFIVSLSSKV